MQFERVPKTKANKFSGYIHFEDNFYNFVDEYSIVGVRWGYPDGLSASYFLRLLQNGSAERARGYGRGYHQEDDDHSNDLHEFYQGLLDHCALWKLSNGSVLCTAMPYGTKESIINLYNSMVEKFDYPVELKIDFLDDEFRYRLNGDYMIAIYYSVDDFDSYCSDSGLYEKAIGHSGTARRNRETVTAAFTRNRYISEYAKRRAAGICQLCGQPAPFSDRSGRPYLESHHIVWLADGGEDTIENTVALCPNCHKKMHVLDLPEDVEKLQKVVKME